MSWAAEIVPVIEARAHIPYEQKEDNFMCSYGNFIEGNRESAAGYIDMLFYFAESFHKWFHNTFLPVWRDLVKKHSLSWGGDELQIYQLLWYLEHTTENRTALFAGDIVKQAKNVQTTVPADFHKQFKRFFFEHL